MSSVYDALTKAGKHTETSGVLTLPWQRISPGWKIMMLVLAVVFVLIVNQLMARVLRTQMDESAVIMTTNLSDAAASYLASKDMLRLRTTVTKYARLSRVAYVFVRDRDGEVIAHSAATFSPELQQGVTFGQDSQVSRRELTLEGRSIYETRAPILDGQLGSAYIGISADAVDREIYQALFMFVWPMTFGIFAAVIVVVILAQPSIRALRRLIELRLLFSNRHVIDLWRAAGRGRDPHKSTTMLHTEQK
jgi:sensor histidine kinase regulating citrate/malate metabolism